MKMFSLCEDGGYFWHFFNYLGQSGEADIDYKQPEKKTGNLVQYHNMLGYGYKLFVDN